MKKIVFALTLALLGTIAVNAQQPRRHAMNPEQMVEKRIERLDKALNLTDQQKAEIAKIYSEEMIAMHKDRPSKAEDGEESVQMSRKDRQQMMRAQREATDAKIESLLTPEQVTKFAELKKHESERGHAKGHKGPRNAEGKKGPRDGCKDDCTCKKND